jgi:hypothetical protein
LLHIRNYAEVLHPAQFEDGTVLGWKIRLLNRIRYRLEVWVQELVLVSQCREAKMSLSERIELFRRFKEENKAEVSWMAGDASRVPAAPALMEEPFPQGQNDQPRLVLDPTPRSTKRPTSIHNLIQNYGGGPKAPRHRHGTSHATAFEPVRGGNDGEFIP